MLTATVVYDLTDAPAERMRHRVATLPEVPSGARVVVRVGALAVVPDVVRMLCLHERRVQLDLQGTPFAVRRWVEAVRLHLGEVLV